MAGAERGRVLARSFAVEGWVSGFTAAHQALLGYLAYDDVGTICVRDDAQTTIAVAEEAAITIDVQHAAAEVAIDAADDAATTIQLDDAADTYIDLGEEWQ